MRARELALYRQATTSTYVIGHSSSDGEICVSERVVMNEIKFAMT